MKLRLADIQLGSAVVWATAICALLLSSPLEAQEAWKPLPEQSAGGESPEASDGSSGRPSDWQPLAEQKPGAIARRREQRRRSAAAARARRAKSVAPVARIAEPARVPSTIEQASPAPEKDPEELRTEILRALNGGDAARAGITRAESDAIAANLSAIATPTPEPETAETPAAGSSTPLASSPAVGLNTAPVDDEPLGFIPGAELDESPLDDGHVRASHIADHPLPVEAPADSLLPPKLRVELWTRWANMMHTVAAYDAAEAAYTQVIALTPGQPAGWLGLGRSRVYAGSWPAAEAAYLVGLGITEQLEAPEPEALFLRHLAELYLIMQEPWEAHRAIMQSIELNTNDPRSPGLRVVAQVTLGLPVVPEARAVAILWPAPRGAHWRDNVEHVLASAYGVLPAPVQTHTKVAMQAIATRVGSRIALALIGGLLVLLLVVRVTRGRGDVVVTLHYPNELQGTFSVHIDSQQGQVKRGPQDTESENRRSTQSDHYLISRETQFRGLRPGRFYIVVQGVLRDPESDRDLTEPFEEHAIEVRSGKTERLDLDVGPTECPIDVQILWDNRTPSEAGVAVRGLPQSLRFTKGGDQRLRLRKGKHVIVAGSGDRVAEQEVDVDSFSTTTVVFELADSDALTFKGCPPAVEPYLHGDLSAAARALERDGQVACAHRILALLHQEQRQPRRAAEHFESAGEFVTAAEMRESISQFAQAAELYERGGDIARAGEMYRKAGDWVNAGDAFETAGNLEEALHCFQQGGESSRVVDTLERHGKYSEAADIALESENTARATQLLQKVGMTDAQYGESCLKLADIYEQNKQPEMAAERLRAHLETTGTNPPHLQDRLAALCEESGNYQSALDTLETIQNSHPDFPNIATRVEVVRKKHHEQEMTSSGATRATGNVSGVATAFLTEQRYEILEELGRGGMGVVLKARDKRLNRIVALKRLPENLREHPRAIQLFMREAQAAARLNHRNIVTVYDTDQEDGIYFITMELLEGRPLNSILREAGKIAPRDVARLGVQVAAGLNYAHDQRVVHRDIKTANLFLTVDRTVKIMDFGLAKMVEQVRRESTVIGGTPYYMAPEQAVGDAVDHRTDIYALGITFYELLTGTVPFHEGDIAFHHRHTAPEDPRARVESIPDELAELIMNMIEKRLELRCASAADVAARLEPLCHK